MTIVIAFISILLITGVIELANRLFLSKLIKTAVCPICAGVSGTWLGMLAARLLGYDLDPAAVTLLMGGSVVGIAHQLEQRLPPNRSPLVFKTVFIPLGFLAAFALASFEWTAFMILLLALIVVSFALLLSSKHDAAGAGGQAVTEIEKKMKNCC